ncbi:hypothetical protein CE91St41_39780 [Oscillospiraceae bacterium]|nr:hypothetical protein CE91St40_39750 [Oscillospiraceae bacterium]BDF77089.1 hypothetical protein CE91St41_39780 [Oscillospiraceae bacterium]
MPDKLGVLLRQEDGKIVSPISAASKDFLRCKRKMQQICRSLSYDTATYDPIKTVHSVDSYIKQRGQMDRILYSEISNYIFSLELNDRTVFLTNVEKLLVHAIEHPEQVDTNSKRIIIKFYDHSQLALHQIENAAYVFSDGIEEAKNIIHTEVKGVQKEYITILGIFAAIVLAFVGGITFSSSVLQNISSASIFRLILVIDLLAFVLITTVYLLIRFIYVLNGNKEMNKIFPIWGPYCACATIALGVIVAWLLNAQELPKYIMQHLPWCQ